MNATQKFMALLATAMTSLAGCGGLSDVGEQETADTPPDAVVTVIGHPSTVNGNKTTLTARAGGEVLLSGKDSDETVLPIIEFDWQMLNDAARQLQVVRRNNTSIAFQVPQQPATLQLRLVVTDSNGRSDTHDVDVTVVDVPDADTFLTYLGTPKSFSVVATSSQDLPPCITPDQQDCLRTDVPFRIEVTTTAHYWDINGVFNDGPTGSANAAVVVGTRTFDGAWSNQLGARSDCNAIENPTFAVAVPQFDADEIAAIVQTATPSRVVDIARIDSTQLAMRVAILPAPSGGASLPAGSAQVCVPAFSSAPAVAPGIVAPAKSTLRSQQAPEGPGAQVTFTLDELLAVLVPEAENAQPDVGVQDTLATARAYYATIDTEEAAAQKKTFVGWLKANGFLPASSGAQLDWAAVANGSDSHATYVNNFDLGFGRDMYARKVRCSHAGPSYAPGDCDIASVVINYGSLEAAAKKLGPLLAVAMEYSQTGNAGPRFVKFYTYAPDIRCDQGGLSAGSCSQFNQVHSANLDGRGEKYMPGACTVCHGGAPLGVDAQGQYANAGDVHASFLPWDQASLLFSDTTDAGFPDDPTNAQHHQAWLQLRKAEQAPQIKALNQLAYLTYADPPGMEQRYALLRELVDNWYAGGGAFDAAFVPQQWSGDAGQRAVYRDVFAQYCRSCHIAQVPAAAAPGISGLDPFSKCNDVPPFVYASTRRQIAFGCYQQFVNATNLVSRVAEGSMPDARLTMDRFWTGAPKSAGQLLAEHLNVATADLRPALRPALTQADVRRPESDVTVTEDFDPVGGDLEVPRRGSFVRLKGGLRGAVGDPTWSVTAPSGTAVSLTAATGLTPSFTVPVPGSYAVSFSAGDYSLSRSVIVPNWVPVASALSRTIPPNTSAVILDVLGNANVARENGSGAAEPLVESPETFAGDGTYSIAVCASGTPAAACTSSSYTTPLGAVVSIVAGNLLPARPVLQYQTSGPGQDEFAYRITDLDGDMSGANVAMTVTALLQASGQTECTFSLGSTNFDLEVSGGTPDFSVDFSNGTGLTATVGQPFNWTYTAPAEDPASATRKIFIGPVSRPYEVTDSSEPVQNASATLSISVLPFEPWTRTLPAPMTSPPNGISGLWSSLGCTAACHGNGGAAGTLTLDGPNAHTNARARVSLGTPDVSRLLVCPTSYTMQNPSPSGIVCGTGPSANHPVKPISVNDATYQAMLRWIKEGAEQNSDARTGCPPQ